MITADPAAMRGSALRLRGQADRVRAIGAGVDARSLSLAFEGPAATRFRASMGDQRRSLERAAEALEQAAQGLDAAAAVVEEEIRAEQVRQAAAEAEARAAAAVNDQGGC